MDKFEYMVLTRNSKELMPGDGFLTFQNTLNRYGDDGWELITSTTLYMGTMLKDCTIQYVLRKKKE